MFKQQQGISIIGFVLSVGFIGFLLFLALRIGPAYWDNHAFGKVLAAMKSEAIHPTSDRRLPLNSRRNILIFMAHRLRIDGVRDIPFKQASMKRLDHSIRVSLDYELRRPVFANIDAVMKFHQSVDLPRK